LIFFQDGQERSGDGPGQRAGLEIIEKSLYAANRSEKSAIAVDAIAMHTNAGKIFIEGRMLAVLGRSPSGILRRHNGLQFCKIFFDHLLKWPLVFLSGFSPRERCAGCQIGSGMGAGPVTLWPQPSAPSYPSCSLEDLVMRTTFDFAPLWRSTIGFDHLADLVDSTLSQTTEDNYPPYNIERTSEDHYRISLAVAGFGVNEIAVTAEHNALTIEGAKSDGAEREYLYQGIAARPFRRVFNLADYVQVKQASFRDGLLVIDLVREVPEAMKPRQIQIASGASPSSQIEQKKVA